ncbi:hypothetical protein AK812_SmicGene44142 [Symbiodinium microadriaticum]|uniref:Uncharacterized protein n=1 Tax=Symbiodinium microadriaticum TaxID=2951 RepID=A0A1Q9BZ77_SYMMI|nr:hypothetical protein AK812_SmicGene44142 [Symbiodinium microadriaticum]
MTSTSESAATDVDAISSSGESSTATDIEGHESDYPSDSYSEGGSDSEYSKCFASSTTSDDGLLDWQAIRRDPVENHRLSAKQKAHVSALGGGMLHAVRSFLNFDLKIMSDCSGADGGLQALKELGIKMDHVSSSESNVKGSPASRCLASNGSVGFEETAVSWRLKLPFYVLENVLGIRRCLEEIVAYQRRHLPGYYHATVLIDAKKLGDDFGCTTGDFAYEAAEGSGRDGEAYRLEMMLYQGFDISVLNVYGMEDKDLRSLAGNVPRHECEISRCCVGRSVFCDESVGPSGKVSGGDEYEMSGRFEVPSARLANLSFNHVFQADEDSSSDEDMFQRNGKSKARMTAALKRKCCKGRCKRNLKPIWKSVCYLVSCFWALSKQGQDGLLWLKVKDMASGECVTTEMCQQDILKVLLDVSLQQDLNGILDPKHLAKKYLPPGKRSDLYHLYMASCVAGQSEVASVKTFYRAFEQSGFSKVLRFRQRPIDIINILRKKLTPMFAKRVEELNIEHVTCVRDWDSELPNAVKLYGAYRRRKRDVDVYRIEFLVVLASVARQLEDKKGEEYADLANWLEKSFPSRYSRGVHYLRQLSGYEGPGSLVEGTGLPVDACLRRIAFGPSLRVMEMVPKEEAKEEEEKGPQPSEAESGVAPMGKVPTTLAGRIEMAFHQVCADGKHIGDVLKSMFPYNFEGNTAFCKVMLTNLAIPAVASKVEPHRAINYIPQDSLHDFWMHPWHIDYSRRCKYGEHGKFPDMCTLRIHFASILNRGFEAFREPLEGINADEITQDEDFAACLASCKYMKGNFTRHERPEMYLFESLALCQRTSEKQSASALDLASVFAEAVRLKRSVLGQKSLRDVLGMCISEYNKAVGRDHKVKQETHKIIYNVLRCPVEMRDLLAQIYGEYRHYNAALTLENLAGDFYVPGTNLGKGEVVEAPMTSREKCISCLSHVSVFLGWTPLQKNAQLSNDMLREMMEMCCLWQWISPSLKRMLGAGPGYDKIVEAWKMGILDRMKLFRLQLRLTCAGHAFWVLKEWASARELADTLAELAADYECEWALDPEMRGVVKAKDVKFEPERLGFVLEAQGDAQQMYLEQGQSKIQNALKQAERSAFELFQKQLMNDQAHFRSLLHWTDVTVRFASMCALQTLHKTGWMQIRSYGDENFPIFNVAPKKRTGVERDYEVKPLDPQLQPWLSSAMTGLQGGVRNGNTELVVYVANLVTQGVVSAPKVSFLVQSLQSGAANMPNSFVGLVFMPNRACDGRTKTKEQKEEEDSLMEKNVNDDGNDADDDNSNKAKVEASSALRDFKYNLQVTLQDPARGLEVRTLNMIFEETTIYGQRNGWHECWLITSTQATTLTRKTIFKRLVIDKVPTVLVFSVTGCFTHIKQFAAVAAALIACFAWQKMRQHLAGTALMKRVLTALDVPKMHSVIVDLFAHDGWIALAVLQLQLENAKSVCAMVAHTDVELKFCKDVIMHSLFSKAKSKQMTINGFPDFAAAMADLSKVHTTEARSDYDYQVTVPVGGCLIVLQALKSKFEASQVVAEEFAKVLEKHDQEFNRDHRAAGPAVGGKNELRLLECVMTDFSMLYDLDEASLWINSDRITNIPSNMEFFGFGSGDFADGATANDVLSDPNGRWFRYCLTGPVKDLLVIVECDRKLPEEVKGLAIWNKVTTLKRLLVDLEDAGELVTIMGHTKTDDELKCNEKIVFIMDPLKSGAKKRKISKVDSQSTESSPSFTVPLFQMNDYEGELQDLNALARDAEGGSGKKKEKREPEKPAMRRLPRFEVKDSNSADGQEQGEEEPEEDDEEEEEEEEAKAGKKKDSGRKKSAAKDKKKKKTDNKKKKSSKKGGRKKAAENDLDSLAGLMQDAENMFAGNTQIELHSSSGSECSEDAVSVEDVKDVAGSGDGRGGGRDDAAPKNAAALPNPAPVLSDGDLIDPTGDSANGNDVAQDMMAGGRQDMVADGRHGTQDTWAHGQDLTQVDVPMECHEQLAMNGEVQDKVEMQDTWADGQDLTQVDVPMECHEQLAMNGEVQDKVEMQVPTLSDRTMGKDGPSDASEKGQVSGCGDTQEDHSSAEKESEPKAAMPPAFENTQYYGDGEADGVGILGCQELRFFQSKGGQLDFAEMDDDETPKKAFRRSPGKPSELPVQEKPQKQKPTAAKSRPKSNAKKPRNSNAKKSPKSGGSPKKAVVSPKSRGSPKKAVVSPKSDGSPKKAKAVVSPKSRCSPKKAVVSPKSGRSPKAKAISPKSGCSLRGKLGMKKMVMKKHKDGKKELKMTRRHIYSRAYHDIYTKKGGAYMAAHMQLCIDDGGEPHVQRFDQSKARHVQSSS